MIGQACLRIWTLVKHTNTWHPPWEQLLTVKHHLSSYDTVFILLSTRLARIMYHFCSATFPDWNGPVQMFCVGFVLSSTLTTEHNPLAIHHIPRWLFGECDVEYLCNMNGLCQLGCCGINHARRAVHTSCKPHAYATHVSAFSKSISYICRNWKDIQVLVILHIMCVTEYFRMSFLGR